MNKEVFRFLKFVVVTVVVLLLLDWALAQVLASLYDKMKGGERGRAHELISKSNSDLYIFGSSRALGHYDPKVFEESLGLSVYNAGRPAQTVLYHLTVFKVILKRHKPKMVILDLNENELIADDKKYDLMSSLLPYYNREEDVRTALQNLNPKYKFYSMFSVLPYNSSLFAIIYRSLTHTPDASYHGYLPYVGALARVIKTEDNCLEKIDPDPLLSEALKEFKRLCDNNNIELLAVISPRYVTYKCERKDLKLLLSELNKIGIRYVDFSSDQKYISNLKWMYDPAHLNREGSVEFSKDIVKLLKRETE